VEEAALAGVKKKAKIEGRTIVFIDESGLSERPHRCRTWAPRGQTPVLQFHFNWKSLSAMAGVTWWNFYFRLFPGSIRSPQVVEFLTHLLRHIPGKLLIIWDGLKSHRSRLVWDFVRQQRGPPLAGVPARLRSGTEPGGVPVVALEAARAAELLSQEFWGTEPLCPQGAAADAPTPYFSHGLLGTGKALSFVTILFNHQ